MNLIVVRHENETDRLGVLLPLGKSDHMLLGSALPLEHVKVPESARGNLGKLKISEPIGEATKSN